FRHALLGEAAYADLLPGERVRLHRAYTKVLTSDPSAGTAAELARHARAANEPGIAITASITAGDEAMAVAGPDEAALHYETALELLTQGGAGLEPSATVDLAVKAVEAAVVAGHHPHATRLASEQLRHLPPHVADHDRARLLHALASAAILAENPPDLVAVTGEALDLIAAEEPSRLRAQLLSLRARALYERYEEEEARRWADEALELAQTLDLPDVAADATTTLVLIQEYTGLPADARPALEARLEGARAAGETAVELRVMFNLGNLLYEAAELEE